MKPKQITMIVAATLGLIGTAVAQPQGGYGGGPGMGPGMMNGYGGGSGMGPGMMNGYGGGYGMGPGMMDGYGGGRGWGMGPGMMGGCGNQSYADLKLSADQRKKIAAIQQETSKAMWQLMGSMHEQRYQQGMSGEGAFDEAAARKAFDSMQQAQKSMFEMRLEARRKIDAVLTPEQREQLNR